MSEILERYTKKFAKSGLLNQQGRQSTPGGAHISRIQHPFPVYVEHADGSVKWDVDGNQLIDYMMGYGALILGHAHPKVNEAVTRRLSQGTHMGSATPLELQWAELVKGLIPSAERVRFSASGTEATLLAIRLARAFTGKKKLVKFHEHFHGWHDYVSLDSGINTLTGIPEETLSTVIVIDPDIDSLSQLLSDDKDIAAVILEPTGGHWGQFPLQNPSFLKGVRELTSNNGVVMIMDEVISAFRVSRGGSQARFGITPDLTTMAKILAGGLPGGAVAGGEDIMGLLASDDPLKRIAHPGTFNANPLSATAGIACLEILGSEPINERADANAEHLKVGLREALGKMEMEGHVHGTASIVHVVLGAECGCGGNICSLPHSVLAEKTSSQAESLKMAMLNEGVDMMGGIGFIVSAVHSERDIENTTMAFERSLQALRAEGAV